MEPDIIKRQIMGGRVIVTGIRIDGVTRKSSEWVELPECTVSLSGLRKRIQANWDPKDAVFAPSRGNVHTANPKRKPNFARLDAVIHEYYPGGGSAPCLPHLPGITSKQIVRRAHDIGVRIKDMKKFYATRPQKKDVFVDTELKVMIRRPWMPLDVVRWVDGVAL